MDYVNQKLDAGLRDETLESNLRVAYNIIFSNFCDKELQNRLEHKVDFTSTIENDPFELLAAIKVMMHTTSHKKLIYPFLTLWTSLAALFKLKQEKEETTNKKFLFTLLQAQSMTGCQHMKLP